MAFGRTPAFLVVLAAVAQGEADGLQVMDRTGRASGTVYPALARLEAQGWVSSRWDGPQGRGPRKRLYRITQAGRAALGGST